MHLLLHSSELVFLYFPRQQWKILLICLPSAFPLRHIWLHYFIWSIAPLVLYFQSYRTLVIRWSLHCYVAPQKEPFVVDGRQLYALFGLAHQTASPYFITIGLQSLKTPTRSLVHTVVWPTLNGLLFNLLCDVLDHSLREFFTEETESFGNIKHYII